MRWTRLRLVEGSALGGGGGGGVGGGCPGVSVSAGL